MASQDSPMSPSGEEEAQEEEEEQFLTLREKSARWDLAPGVADLRDFPRIIGKHQMESWRLPTLKETKNPIFDCQATFLCVGVYSKEGSFAYMVCDNKPEVWVLLRKYRYHLNKAGYAQTCVEGKSFCFHQHFYFAPKGLCIDHWNHDKLDNRLINLRVVSPLVNTLNRDHSPEEVLMRCITNTPGCLIVKWRENNVKQEKKFSFKTLEQGATALAKAIEFRDKIISTIPEYIEAFAPGPAPILGPNYTPTNPITFERGWDYGYFEYYHY